MIATIKRLNLGDFVFLTSLLYQNVLVHELVRTHYKGLQHVQTHR